MTSFARRLRASPGQRTLRRLVVRTLLCAAAACGSTDQHEMPAGERTAASLSKTETEQVCAELERLTIEDPDYARGPCTHIAAGVTDGDPSLSCREIRDACVDDFAEASRQQRPCWLTLDS